MTRTEGPARFAIAVGSGKGGVGKSTVALNLALALRGRGAVGLLDADLYGPDIPLMVGVRRSSWTHDWTLARASGPAAQTVYPVVERFGLRVMSAGFILGEDQAMGLDATAASMLTRQLIRQVAWGDLKYLIVDLPPGTADVQRAVVREMPLSGAIVVVTPQDVAHLDGRKAVQMFRHTDVSVLGAVENMAAFGCPHCGEVIEVFPPVEPARAVWSMEVERLGSIPLSPALARAGDSGEPLFVREPGSPQATAFREVARRVAEKLAPR